jgi:hypothetical protein
VAESLTFHRDEKLIVSETSAHFSEGLQMFVLMLIGYTVWGGTPFSLQGPVHTQIGYFPNKGACTAAIAQYNPGTDLKNETTMNEYRWALLCLPAGTGLQNH